MKRKQKMKSLGLVFLFVYTSFRAVAQERQLSVKGEVQNETGAPISGATVSIANEDSSVSKQTAANDQGIFSFYNLVPGLYHVNIKAVGYVAERFEDIKYDGKKIITLSYRLSTANSQLNDVVIVGYGSSSRRDVTGAITSVKSDELNQGVLTTPAELLQGKVAGLNVTKSGDPNQQPSVVLRGPSTIRSGDAQQPFYVIDGVPGASIDLLAPAEIESIDVLKDASSTAIYGARAANGVIIITTKKVRPGQTRLSYSGYGAMQKVSKKYDMLTGDELRKYLADNNVTPLASPIDDDGSNTDWQDLIERTGYSQSQNLLYGGSSKNGDYGASVTYMKNNGIINRTSLGRTIYKGYINQRFFNDRLKLSLNITNSNTNQDDVDQKDILPEMLYYLPTVSPFNPDGTYKENYNRTGSGTRNPLSLLNNNTYTTNDNKTLINGIVTVDILKGLKYTFSGSSQKDQIDAGSYLNSQSSLAVGANGIAHQSAYRNSTTVIESYFNYDRYFGRHSLKLLGGYSFEQDKSNEGFGVQTQNFSNDNLGSNNLFLSNPTQLSQIVFDNNPISTLRLISYYARAQYSYADKYLLSASLRNDGSSAFGANNRWGYFPAISAGWRIIDEDFMKKLPVFSDLKLRAGYGVSGNSLGFDAFSSLLVYGTPSSSKFIYDGAVTNAIGPIRNDNPNLKWESTGTMNIGLDFGLYKDRISGSVDYYIKKTSDLIYDGYTVSTTQYFVPTITANVGKISNRGVEVLLNFVPVKSKNFTWKSSLNFSHNHNNIDNLSNSQFQTPYFYTAQVGGKGQSGIYSQIVEPGQPLGTFYLWHYTGKNAQGISTYRTANGDTTSQQPTSADQFIAGNAQPTLLYGFNNTFTYKNFDLNFFIRGVMGNKILNATLAALNDPASAKLQNIPKSTLNESFNDINAYLLSDRFLESGSYLRLDNASLGYTIRPKTQAIKTIRLYLSVNNLFVITKYKGVDPEINIGGLNPGIDNDNFYPKTRTFLFGVNASF